MGRAIDDIPGIESIRATYRWFAVTRMALILLAGLAIAELARGPGRRRQVLAVVLAGVAVVEVLPTCRCSSASTAPTTTTASRCARRSSPTSTERRATASGRSSSATTVGTTTSSPTTSRRPHGLRAYNAGGDKNSVYAARAWPPEVQAIAAPSPPPEAVEQALRSGKVDVVVLPSFHLQENSSAWPPSPQQQAAAKQAFEPIASAPGLDVRRYRWFTTVRLS